MNLKEKNNSKEESFNPYIEWLKFICCVIVLLSHFWGIFYSLSAYPISFNTIVRILLTRVIPIIFNSNWCVVTFCIISGYFASKSKISSITDFIKKCITRYVRFLKPFFTVNFLIFLIDKAGGFQYVSLAGDILSNEWLKNSYHPYSFLEVIKSSLTLGASMNSPLWMLRQLFVGDILCYFIKLLNGKVKHSKPIFGIIFSLLLI